MTGELWSIIQAHLDRYGVYEAVFARRMGTKPQTINTWKILGVKRLPERWLLEAVAREAAVPYEAVLRAALVDSGYLDTVTPETDDAQRGPRSEQEAAGVARPAPHSTTVTEADIAAGASLPLVAPAHRRTLPSSDTKPRRHTN